MAGAIIGGLMLLISTTVADTIKVQQPKHLKFPKKQIEMRLEQLPVMNYLHENKNFRVYAAPLDNMPIAVPKNPERYKMLIKRPDPDIQYDMPIVKPPSFKKQNYLPGKRVPRLYKK